MPIRAGRSKNDSTDDDAAAFAEAVSGTRKLGGAARISPTPGGHAGRRLPPSRPALPPAQGGMSIDDGGDTWTARADGVDATAGQKHRVTRARGNVMETFRHFAGLDFFLKFRARDAAFESDEQFRAGRGVGNEPHFSLGFATEFGSLVRRRMDL